MNDGTNTSAASGTTRIAEAAGAAATVGAPPKADTVVYDKRKFWLAQFITEHGEAPDSPLNQAGVFAEDFDDARGAVEDALVGKVLHQSDVTGIKMVSLTQTNLPPVLTT